MFKLQAPIPKRFCNKKGEYYLTQLFGENKVDFYKKLGLPGHNGLDWATKFVWKWVHNWFDKQVETDPNERLGVIPVLASHDGYLMIGKNNDRTRGIYMTIMSPEYFEDGEYRKIETVYFHLDRLRRYKGDGYDDKDFVRAGTIIGYSDNTGEYTTGSHLHFGVRPWIKQKDGTWDYSHDAYNGFVDPLNYLNIKYRV